MGISCLKKRPGIEGIETMSGSSDPSARIPRLKKRPGIEGIETPSPLPSDVRNQGLKKRPGIEGIET